MKNTKRPVKINIHIGNVRMWNKNGECKVRKGGRVFSLLN